MAVPDGSPLHLWKLDLLVEVYMDAYGVTRTEAKKLIRRDLKKVY